MRDFVFVFALVVGTSLSRETVAKGYDPKYGTFVGRFLTLHHNVSGEVYAIDNATIYIRRFFYDGEAPDAYFFAGGKGSTPSNRGFIIPDEKGSKDPLGPYKNRNFVLKFPITRKGQRSFHDVNWISVWCRKFGIDFGYIQIPADLTTPSPTSVGSLSSNNGIIKSSNVIMEDSETITINDFSYDGSIPDAIFVMGSGEKNSEGHQVPNENGSKAPLSRYNRKTLSLKLPKHSKVNHLQYFGIWSPSEGLITSVTFPDDMRVPPSLNSL